MIDDTFKPWLLEVNLSPACEERTPWISTMLERMAGRLLDIVVENKTEPDGVLPDWIRISDSTRKDNHPCDHMSSTVGDSVIDLAAVGRPLNIRSERLFEYASRRKEAHGFILRVARGFLGRRRVHHMRRCQAATCGA